MSARWRLVIYGIASNELLERSIDAAAKTLGGVMRAPASASAAGRVGVVLERVGPSGATRQVITPGRRSTSEALSFVDPADPGSLTQLLDAAADACPADRTALVIWAHGSGLDLVVAAPPEPGERARLGPGPQSQRFLTNAGVRSAIEASRAKAVALLGFNACNMALFEVAYTLRNVCQVLVASQARSDPWRYADIVRRLCATPSMSPAALGRAMVASAVDPTSADTLGAFAAGPPLEALKEAFDAYAAAVGHLLPSGWRRVSDEGRALLKVDDPYQCDLGSLLKIVGGKSAAVRPLARAAAAALAGLDPAVKAGALRRPRPSGLSVFFPRTARLDIAAAYRNLDFPRSPWERFLVDFEARLPA